jgi:RimJ/RimL family protein N-acetyltransferase
MRFCNDIGVFEIDSLPSQVQVGVCHGFFVHEHKRGQGLASVLHARQIKELRDLGYDYAICTVSGENPAQSKAIKNAGWTLTNTFFNRRICQKTEVWELDIVALNRREQDSALFGVLPAPLQEYLETA